MNHITYARIFAIFSAIWLAVSIPVVAEEQPSDIKVAEKAKIDLRLKAKQQNGIAPSITPLAFADVRGTSPPVHFGLKYHVYTIAICVTHNSFDQDPNNDWIEFHTYQVDSGPEKFEGDEETFVGIDYAEYAIARQAAIERDKGSTDILLGVNRFCEVDNYASRRTEGEQTVIVSDLDRKISRSNRPFWRAEYGYQTIWNKLGCERSWNGHCRMEETMELRHLESILNPEEMQVCSYYFNETHLSGWHADYRIAPIITGVSADNPKGYVTGYYLSLKANGNEVPIDRIGARVDLSNIGITYVSRRASVEDMSALKCNPRITTYRTTKNARDGAIPPAQCRDSDGVGYYCSNEPPNGNRSNGGISIGNW